MEYSSFVLAKISQMLEDKGKEVTERRVNDKIEKIIDEYERSNHLGLYKQSPLGV